MFIKENYITSEVCIRSIRDLRTKVVGVLYYAHFTNSGQIILKIAVHDQWPFDHVCRRTQDDHLSLTALVEFSYRLLK